MKWILRAYVRHRPIEVHLIHDAWAEEDCGTLHLSKEQWETFRQTFTLGAAQMKTHPWDLRPGETPEIHTVTIDER